MVLSNSKAVAMTPSGGPHPLGGGAGEAKLASRGLGWLPGHTSLTGADLTLGRGSNASECAGLR